MADDTRSELAALTSAASDVFTVRRVFGEPYEYAGTLVVPVAKVLGSHGIAGAHGDARLGIRKGQQGPGAPEGEDQPTDQTPEDGSEQSGEQAAPPWAGGGPGHGHWHGGPGRGQQWPFGSGRPAGRGVGQADTGGFATRVKPLGVFVIGENGTHWRPALDLNRVILGGQIVAAVSVVAFAVALRKMWS